MKMRQNKQGRCQLQSHQLLPGLRSKTEDSIPMGFVSLGRYAGGIPRGELFVIGAGASRVPKSSLSERLKSAAQDMEPKLLPHQVKAMEDARAQATAMVVTEGLPRHQMEALKQALQKSSIKVLDIQPGIGKGL